MAKVIKKQKAVIDRTCSNCFSPTHLKFNFSFITYEKNFNEQHQIQLLKRIRELSSVTYLELLSWGKEIGFEFEKIEIKKTISREFFCGNSHRKFDDRKYAIFRLYSNNNPVVARVIGKIIKNVFYIFFIDIGGNLYSHGK